MAIGRNRPSNRGGVRSWRDLNWFLLLYFGSIFFAIFVAPSVQRAIWCFHRAAPSPLTSYLIGQPFARIFDRIRWIPILAILPWVMGTSGHFHGFCKRNRPFCRPFSRFFLQGLLFAGLLVSCQLLFLGCHWKGVNLLWALVAGLLGSCVVGLLEEIVFREFLLSAAAKSLGRPAALLFSALFFAYVHFKFPGDCGRIFGPHVPLDRSLAVGYSMVFGVLKGGQWLPFCSLFFLGLILNLMRIRYGNLVGCIGFHSGIVFALIIQRKLVFINEMRFNSFFLSENLVASPACLILLVMIAIYHHVRLPKGSAA